MLNMLLSAWTVDQVSHTHSVGMMLVVAGSRHTCIHIHAPTRMHRRIHMHTLTNLCGGPRNNFDLGRRQTAMDHYAQGRVSQGFDVLPQPSWAQASASRSWLMDSVHCETPRC